MERIEDLKSKKSLSYVLSNKKAKYIIGTILLSALGIALPRIFHLIAGAESGKIFLPMHIAVLISALTFGITSSLVVAGSTTIGSYLIAGMPTLARMPYTLIELAIYAVLVKILNKKFNSYISLIATIILGRIVYAGMLFVGINYFGLNTYGMNVIETIKTGLPGIIIQLLSVPLIAKYMNKKLELR